MKYLLPITTLLVLTLVLVSWVFYPAWSVVLFNISDSDEGRALFGDSFGMLNTLFSGLAFTGIITSIFLQSQELKETRKEIKGQKDEFVLQTKAMKKQIFDTTFFQLIQLHNEIVQSLKVKSGTGSRVTTVEGRDAFSVLYKQNIIKGIYPDNANKNSLNINEFYLCFHKEFGHLVGHYFRNIYQILKYIDSSDIENKKFYTNLIRAQLSNYELGVLFYNCLSNIGDKTGQAHINLYEEMT